MELTKLNLTKRQTTFLNKKNIECIEDLLRYFPFRYNDFSKITGFQEGVVSCVIGKIKRIKRYDNRYFSTTATLETTDGETFFVTWMNMPYMMKRLQPLHDVDVLVCAKFSLGEYRHKMECMNPILFSAKIKEDMRIFPVYRKIEYIGTDVVPALIQTCLTQYAFTEWFKPDLMEKYGLMPLYQAYNMIHMPDSMDKVELAKHRICFDDLMYYSLQQRASDQTFTEKSPYIIRHTDIAGQLVSKLPYSLSEDQSRVVREILDKMQAGKTVWGLVQGDVGCGKSIVCFLLAAVTAGNGYQAAIMAPNRVLARQHYEDLKGLLDGTGIKVDLLISGLKEKERMLIMDRISSGETDIVVGTSSLLSATFKGLGLIVVDEEHKFGVKQRDMLMEKGKNGIHMITMSATPIPRTLAKTMYSQHMEVYPIHTMPNGRKRIKNCVTDSWSGTFRFMRSELEKGHQVYVVCPMIEKNDHFENLLAIETVVERYEPALEGYKYGVLTGKTPKKDSEKIIDAFSGNEIQVLFATSVIEVGINVPNATGIIIHNAERFGLAALHQLRGRVGRGEDQAYCVFFSDDLANERLHIIENTTDGYDIAQEDLRLRKPGDIVNGYRQSGKNEFMRLVVEHPDVYEECKRMIAETSPEELNMIYDLMKSSIYANI